MTEEATLLYVTNTKDSDGFPVEHTESVTVSVREKSATRTEYYEALRAGKTVSMVLEVRQEDWELTRHQSENGRKAYATRAEYDGDVYDIVRTYKNDKSMIELICA